MFVAVIAPRGDLLPGKPLLSVNYISDGTRAGLSASAHASRYLSGPGRLSRPTPFPQKGRAKPLDVPGQNVRRVFARSTTFPPLASA
jgi:hypothetical protein